MSSSALSTARGSVTIAGLTKRYQSGGRGSLRSLVGRGRGEEVVALQGIDLQVEAGESVGIIGANGSGKSTLLKLLAGVTLPSAGTVRCVGTVGSMIELGLGFHPVLSGVENVRSSAALAGLSRSQIDAMLPEVIEFSGIGAAVEEPLRHYSTGMQARLGFALATHLPVDLLVVDEVLAVGDAAFQMRCIDRIAQLLDAGTTLLLVSHEMWLIDSICKRAVQLKDGRVVDDGAAPEVIGRYLAPTLEGTRTVEEPTAEILGIEVVQPEIRPWDELELVVEVEVSQPIEEPRLALEMSWKAIAPDRRIAHTELALPEAAWQPGRHRLRLRTSPIPLDSGHGLLQVALLTEDDGSLLSSAGAEFWVRGEVARQRPGLATPVRWSLSPTEAPAEEGPEGAGTLVDERPVAAVITDVEKRFASDRHLRWLRGPQGRDEVVAVDGVSLTLARGQVTGLIGPNGAGKTTLLRMLAGVSAPTAGTVQVSGHVVSMLELGIGFHDDLTGLENLRLSGRLLGMSRRQITDRLDDVLAFADIGDAVEHPIRQCSTGMQARLGLSLALHADADLLLIDETLAVGDQDFQERAVRLLRERCAEGAAVVFVAHALDLVAEVSDRVVRIDKGRVVDDGSPDEVIARAGGRTAMRGARQVSSTVRLLPVEVPSLHLVEGDDLELHGLVEVVHPASHVRIEVSYRAARDRDPSRHTDEEILMRRMMVSVVQPAGGDLSSPGWYRYHSTIERNAFRGPCFVFVTAIDEVEGRVIAETWHDFVSGARASKHEIQLALDATWVGA